MMNKLPAVQVKYDYIKMAGGWDQITPTLALASGFVKDASNFEVSTSGGYTRIAGYERFSGLPSPSAATYVTVFISAFLSSVTIGDTLTGGTSLATGVVIAVGANFIVVTKHSGDYSVGENVLVGATVIGVTIVPNAYITPTQNAQYLALAADNYRADIVKMDGMGGTLGCFLYNDVVYAFRRNAGNTSNEIYKSSAAGWVNVPLNNQVYFTAASTTPAEGSTVTQGGVTARVLRVVLQSGAYLGGTATGKLIIDTQDGGNFAAGAFTAGFTATCAGAQTAITIPVSGGKYEFETGNFAGSAATNRVYGCDGLNKMFEFDGSVYVPIDTGAAVDTPKHIAIHKNLLFCSIGASIMYSAAGEPYNWNAVAYAGEIGTGENVTGLKVLTGSTTSGTLLVTSKNNIYMLYGTNGGANSDFNFVTFNNGAGALDYTIQNMSDTYLMDDRGVVSLKTSLNFGNFDQSTLTFNINKFIDLKKTLTSYACLDRRKSQYRLFFSDGYGLYLTIVNGQHLGSMPVLFPNPVYMATEGKYSTGDEASFFCSTDGHVYQLDKGTSFDGASIDAYLTFTYNASSSARILKRYRKMALEVSGEAFCQIKCGYLLGYSKSEYSQQSSVNYDTNLQSLVWDAFTWDNFTWDGKTIVPNECEMIGTAENVGITIRSGTNMFKPFTVNSAIIHYSHRRGLR